MLRLELQGRKFNKREHNRRLQPLVRDRTPGAIERKHMNISAVLIEVGFPYIAGYQPLRNYQDLLREVIVDRLTADRTLNDVVAGQVVSAPRTIPEVKDIASIVTEVPQHTLLPSREHRTPRLVPSDGLALPVNYLEREARNRALGLAGEKFVVRFEQFRLERDGLLRLASRVEHVSATRGDGLGFDVRSFEADGGDRLIEVKTTAYGSNTPFFVSANERRFSEEHRAEFALYRVYRFREAPKLFMLPGALDSHCKLEPSEFRAYLR
jgi:hypothetical protein